MRFVTLGVCSYLLVSAVNATTLQKIIMDGDHDPLSSGTVTLFSIGANAGKLFVTVHLSGPGITTANDYAWLYGNPTSLKQLYREGQPIPGGSGQIGFMDASLGVTGLYGLRIQDSTGHNYVGAVGDGSVTTAVVHSGDPAPGTTSTFQSMLPTNVLSTTQYSLVAQVNGKDAEYRTKANGSLQLKCVAGQVMPGLAPENTTQFITNELTTASASLFSLAYQTPSNPFSSSGYGVFLATDAGTQLLIKAGDPQPVSPPAGASFSRPAWLGSDGSYVVLSGFVDSNNAGYGVGLYSGRNGSLTLRRLPSQIFVDQGSASVSTIDTYDPTSIGQMLARATLSNNSSVIGIGDVDNGFHTLLKSGSSPTGIAGVQFHDFGIQTWQAPQMDAAGDVIFFATLSGSGVTASNDYSVWYYSHDTHASSLLAREGDSILVDGVTRTIDSLEFAAPFFDAQGTNAIFKVRFTDNALGLFSAVVPEPAGLVVLFCAAIGMRRCRLPGARTRRLPGDKNFVAIDGEFGF